MANVISFQREPEFYYDLALKAIKNSDYATAIRELLTAIKIDEKPEYLRELAECYYLIGAYRESIDIFYKLYEFSYSQKYVNKIIRSYYRIENTLFDDLDIEDMELDDFAEILDMPLKPGGNSANFWVKTNNIDETIQKLGDFFSNEKAWLIKIDTKEIRDREKLASAVLALNNGDYDRAISLALEVISDENSRSKALKVLATAGVKVEDYELSLRSANELIEIKGEEVAAFNVLLYLAKFTNLENKPNVDELCKDVFDKIVGRNSVEDMTLYGIFAFNMDEAEYAVKALETVYNNCPLNVDVIHNYATALMKVGRFSDARKVVKRARVLFPMTAILIFDEWVVDNANESTILDENNFILDKFVNEEATVLISQIIKLFEGEVERAIIEDGALCRITNGMLDIMYVLISTNDLDAVKTMLFRLDGLDDVVYEKFLFECLKSVYLGDEIRELILFALITMPRKIDRQVELVTLPYVRSYRITSIEFFGDMNECEADVYVEVITTLFKNKIEFVDTDILHSFIKEIGKDDAFKSRRKNVIAGAIYCELNDCEDSQIDKIAELFNITEETLLKALEELFNE